MIPTEGQLGECGALGNIHIKGETLSDDQVEDVTHQQSVENHMTEITHQQSEYVQVGQLVQGGAINNGQVEEITDYQSQYVDVSEQVECGALSDRQLEGRILGDRQLEGGALGDR